MLDNLTMAVEELHSGRIHPVLYPILTILSRFRPTRTMDEDKVQFQYPKFISLILKCAVSPLFKVREMTARALFPMIAQDSMEDMVDCISIQQNNSTNEVHGSLLIFEHMLERTKLGESGVFQGKLF